MSDFDVKLTENGIHGQIIVLLKRRMAHRVRHRCYMYGEWQIGSYVVLHSRKMAYRSRLTV